MSHAAVTLTVYTSVNVGQTCINTLFILAFFKRAGHLKLNKALDLIGYLQSETHTVPLLKGLGYLELFYHIVEKRNEILLTKKLGVSSQ